MNFVSPLVEGLFLRRYKRFFVDVELKNGLHMTGYCPNTGKMSDLLIPGSPVYLSLRQRGKGLPFIWEMVQIDRTLIGVNTHTPNRLIYAALAAKTLLSVQQYDQCIPEVFYSPQTRFDFLLKSTQGLPDCYIEVKNVHLKRGQHAIFPDTVTTRGSKHLRTLSDLKMNSPARALVIYVIQRQDCEAFAVANDIDPIYAQAARTAFTSGVEFLAYRCKMTPHSIELDQMIPIDWT